MAERLPPFGIGDQVIAPRGPGKVVGMRWRPPYNVVNSNSTYEVPGHWEATVIYDVGPDLPWAIRTDRLKSVPVHESINQWLGEEKEVTDG